MVRMIPKTIGRYKVKSKIAEGGMATILRGHDPRFKRDVAIKMLPHEFLHDRTFRTRFEREAETIAALEHPAIVPVYDYGEEDGQPFFVMRYMPGGSLADRIMKGPLPVAEAARLVARLAPGLDTAHAKGIIHRDLKPANILFDQYNEPYISDFGIVKINEAGMTLTGTAMTIGTPDYMSPEQASGDARLDGRSDIYALGIMLFEMLTGHTPYVADTPLGMAYKHVNEPLPHVLDKKPTLPPGCQTVIEKATAKRREDRYPNATAMAEALSVVARSVAAPSKDTGAMILPGKTAKSKTAADKLPKSKTAAEKASKGKASAKPKVVNTQATTVPLGLEKITVSLPFDLRTTLESAAAILKRRIWIVPVGVVGVCLLLGVIAVVWFAITMAARSSPKAVVNTVSANVRTGPGVDSSQLTDVSKGDELEIKGRSADGKWLLVVLPDQRQGWISASLVETAVNIDRLPVVETPPP
jgi:serine/threonine protein kinase